MMALQGGTQMQGFVEQRGVQGARTRNDSLGVGSPF